MLFMLSFRVSDRLYDECMPRAIAGDSWIENRN